MRGFKEYFHYSSGERKGALLLVGLLCLAITAYWIVPNFASNSVVDYKGFEKDLTIFFDTSKIEHEVLMPELQEKKDSLFFFDPNEIKEEEWILLGFSPKQAASIVKYQIKYGFELKGDVEKLYVISKEKYKQIEPFMLLKEEETKKYLNYSTYQEVKKGRKTSMKDIIREVMVEVNSADTSEFKLLRGIGSYYASKIVRFRKALGGFYSLEQLKEVYGIKPEIIEQNWANLLIDTTALEKIDVNTVAADELKKHPYLNWNIANSIVQIRNRHGNYISLEEIKKSDLVNDELYRKIAPYLKIE